MIDSDIGIGIIGLGTMGTHHLRVLSSIPEVKIKAVVDLDDEKRNSKSRAYRIENAYKHYEDFLEREEVDAIIIAVQPEHHRRIALACFEKKVPILLEKPIAHTRDDALEIVAATEKGNIVCLVGHIERFNPVIRKTKRFIEDGQIGKPYLCNTRRCGPFPRRLLSTNLGVLIDLATHDVDIVQYLSGERISDLQAMFIKTGRREIFAKVLYRCESGLAGSMEFSWISPQKIRDFQLFGSLGLIEGDYVTQSLKFHENPDESVVTDPWASSHLAFGRIASGRIIEYPIWRSEPLREELEHFIACVKGEAEPEVTPQIGAQVIDVVLRITEEGNAARTTSYTEI